jgi:ATP-dependent helicase/nuclease subunit B
MSVRFILGRAGCGKTHWCLEAIRARLRQDPVDGPRLVLLVPEQAGLQMERAIIAPEDIGGAHRAEVLSFRRLAFRVLEAGGGTTRRALSEPARAMVLRHIVAQNITKMRYYRRVERLGGFIEQLSTTISELIQEAIEPGDLLAVAGDAEATNAPQQAKLHDIQFIYAEYLRYLGTERLDPSQYLQVARECLPRVPWLTGAEVWVDGFASLARQETLTLLELAKLAGAMDVTVLCDPELASSPPLKRWATQERWSSPLFSKTRQTYGDLHHSFIEAGVAVEDPVLLPARKAHRFKDNESLRLLERTLFVPSADRPLEKGTGTAAPTTRDAKNHVSYGASPLFQRAAGVELIELPSRRVEVDYAVSRICRWVQDRSKPMRYRDIAVIVRDLEPYHDLLTGALTARGIPFFIDRRRPTAHHPLIELLRSAVTAASTDVSLDSVRCLLKTGLMPVSVESADELENYLLAQGVFGFERWSGDDWAFAPRSAFADDPEHQEPSRYEADERTKVNATRKALLAGLGEWLASAMKTEGHIGKQWAESMVALLKRLEVPRRLAEWATTAELDGDLDQAEEHRQVWRDTLSFLDDLAFALADMTLTATDVATVLETGLSQFTLGLAPPMLDQVLVGSIERSRHPELKAVVLLGVNEGLFPKVATEDSILNDDDRTLLSGAGLHLAPPARQRTLEEPLLFYVAATRASRALVVTYATADNNGKALQPSPYISALQSACPGLAVKIVGDPVRQRATWDIVAPRDLTRRLTAELGERTSPGDEDQPAVRARWNELYETVRGDLITNDAMRRSFSALVSHEKAALSPKTVERWIGGTFRTSVSQLETYAACPFQHFAKYTLKLRERAVAELQPVDVGKVHHAVLEDFVNALWDRRQVFGQLSDAELAGGLHESCARVAARLPAQGALSYARDAYVLGRSAAHLGRVLRAQRRVGAAGSARPRAAEVPYGFPQKGGLSALELSTPAGRRVLLRGFIDRVDLAELADEMLGIVIDYKRTHDKRLDLTQVYHGLSLQLVAYLLVLAEHGASLAGRPVRPVGAFYVSLLPRYESVEHPDAHPQEAEEEVPVAYRPRGLLAADGFDALDATLGESGRSKLYSVYRKKDGGIGYVDRSDGAGAEDFRAVLEHTREKLGTLADGILDGDVAVNPYRLKSFSPCSWCPMSNVCRFEMGLSDVRFLESLKRSDIFRRLRGGERRMAHGE